ncbi:MAG: GNAT family N-acetyltransferase [Chlorobi bacterium CHB2]|nr:GNAT family N-acetyltransferase [Chlorobi bacterium CHB2]
MTEPNFHIRPATPADSGLIHSLIAELAEYERLRHEMVATEQSIHQALFGESPRAEVILACVGQTVVGFALFFHNFSTFLGRSGVYLEDLFVRPEHRGNGYGKALLQRLAQIAVGRGCGRMEWSVLDWNQPSIDFYKSLGATPMDEWTVYRLTGADLESLAKNHSEGTIDNQ